MPGITTYTGWLNVMDFGLLGSVGSGNSDDGLTFQRAINAVPAGGALILVPVPASSYNLVTSPTFGSKTGVQFWLMPGVTFTGPGAMPAASGTNGYFGHALDGSGNIVLGTATSKIGLFGAAAIVRPSAPGSATGYAAGATVATFHSDDTYTGNVGSTAYTINGLVAALKNIGLLTS